MTLKPKLLFSKSTQTGDIKTKPSKNLYSEPSRPSFFLFKIPKLSRATKKTSKLFRKRKTSLKNKTPLKNFFLDPPKKNPPNTL